MTSKACRSECKCLCFNMVRAVALCSLGMQNTVQKQAKARKVVSVLCKESRKFELEGGLLNNAGVI